MGASSCKGNYDTIGAHTAPIIPTPNGNSAKQPNSILKPSKKQNESNDMQRQETQTAIQALGRNENENQQLQENGAEGQDASTIIEPLNVFNHLTQSHQSRRTNSMPIAFQPGGNITIKIKSQHITFNNPAYNHANLPSTIVNQQNSGGLAQNESPTISHPSQGKKQLSRKQEECQSSFGSASQFMVGSSFNDKLSQAFGSPILDGKPITIEQFINQRLSGQSSSQNQSNVLNPNQIPLIKIGDNDRNLNKRAVAEQNQLTGMNKGEHHNQNNITSLLSAVASDRQNNSIQDEPQQLTSVQDSCDGIKSILREVHSGQVICQLFFNSFLISIKNTLITWSLRFHYLKLKLWQ